MLAEKLQREVLQSPQADRQLTTTQQICIVACIKDQAVHARYYLQTKLCCGRHHQVCVLGALLHDAQHLAAIWA